MKPRRLAEPDRAYYTVLATANLRRLLKLRHHPRDGRLARRDALAWIGTLRAIKRASPSVTARGLSGRERRST